MILVASSLLKCHCLVHCYRRYHVNLMMNSAYAFSQVTGLNPEKLTRSSASRVFALLTSYCYQITIRFNLHFGTCETEVFIAYTKYTDLKLIS